MDISEKYDEALSVMRERGGSWYAYRNESWDSAAAGNMVFLRAGSGCTYESPPKVYPGNIPTYWAYILLGEVDLAAGEVKEKSRGDEAQAEVP